MRKSNLTNVNLIIILAAIAITSCGGGGNNNTVTPPSIPATASISANPTTVFLGESTIVSWSSTSASSCSASGYWSGTKSTSGSESVASCDLAIASNEAKFATPGVNIGLFCSTPMVALSRNVANKHAMEMLLTGDLIPADKAKEIGLINNHVDNNILREEVNNLAKKIASKPAMTLKIGKKAFYKQSKLDLEQAYQYTSEVMLDNMLKDDAKEGINAFIEKRDPNWKDN